MNITYDNVSLIFDTILNVWWAIFIFLTLYVYYKGIRPYKVSFNEEYFKGIPDDLNIVEVSNLVNKKINADTLAAYVVNLIGRKILKVEIEDGEEYIRRGSYKGKLSIGDEATVKLILYTMGDGDQVKISQLYNFCNRKRNKSIMLMEFQIWCKIMKKENYKHIFFEMKEEYPIVKFMSIFGSALFFINVFGHFNNILAYLTLLPAILLLLVYSKVFKRTRFANEEYYKWMAFKAYLENIEQFDDEIAYPEEYLAYSICLGIKGLETKITNHSYSERLVEALNRCVVKAVLSGNRNL